jgi:hypothetical protein
MSQAPLPRWSAILPVKTFSARAVRGVDMVQGRKLVLPALNGGAGCYLRSSVAAEPVSDEVTAWVL